MNILIINIYHLKVTGPLNKYADKFLRNLWAVFPEEGALPSNIGNFIHLGFNLYL